MMHMKCLKWTAILMGLILMLSGCGIAQDEKGSSIESEPAESRQEEQAPSQEEAEEPETPDPIPEEGGMLRLSMVISKDYNPLTITDPYAAQVLSLIFSPLIDFDQQGYPHEAIVSEWEMASDNRSATFTINPDVQWQNGSDVTAGDVAYSVSIIQNAENSIYAPCLEHVTGVNVLDNDRFEVYFDISSPLNMNRLYFPVISRDYYSQSGHELEPMGTGPYMLESYVTMQKFVLTANPTYYGTKPYIPTVEIDLTRSEVRKDSFDREVTNLVYMDEINWSGYINKSTVGVHVFPSSELEMLTMNLERIPEADTRKAIAYAMDAREILRTTNVEKGDVTEIPISPVLWYGPDNPSHYGLNSDKVAELLDLSEQLTIELLVDRDDSLQMAIAEEISSELAQQGIQAVLSAEDHSAYEQALQAGEFDAAIETVEASTDLDLRLFLTDGWNNHSGYISETMRTLLDEEGAQTEETQIHQGFVKIGSQLAEDLPVYPLFFLKKATLTGNGVMGQLSPTDHYVFRGVENLFMESR